MQTADLARNGIVKKLETYERLFYGFSYVGDIVPPNYKHLPHAITIGQPLSPAIIDAIAAGPNDAYYAEYLSVNDRLDLITGQLEAEIEKLGYFAHAVLSSQRTDFVNIAGEFPHKSAAVRAGLGWIGKSSLFITREYGPRIRLSTVLTDIPCHPVDYYQKTIAESVENVPIPVRRMRFPAIPGAVGCRGKHCLMSSAAIFGRLTNIRNFMGKYAEFAWQFALMENKAAHMKRNAWEISVIAHVFLVFFGNTVRLMLQWDYRRVV